MSSSIWFNQLFWRFGTFKGDRTCIFNDKFFFFRSFFESILIWSRRRIKNVWFVSWLWPRGYLLIENCWLSERWIKISQRISLKFQRQTHPLTNLENGSTWWRSFRVRWSTAVYKKRFKLHFSAKCVFCAVNHHRVRNEDFLSAKTLDIIRL